MRTTTSKQATQLPKQIYQAGDCLHACKKYYINHCQNFSTRFFGGGSSYESASISAIPETKSMSWGLTCGERYMTKRPMMYMIGKSTKGR